MPVSRIAELASIISTNTTEVDTYLSTHGLPPLSFEVDNVQDYILPESVQAAKNVVLEATDELHAHMLGPIGILMQQSNSCNQLMSIQAINRFRIAECFPEDQDKISYAELCHSTGLQEFHLRRILRHAMTLRIFTEPTSNSVGHTAASRMLTRPYLHEWFGLICDEMWPAATKAVDALVKWPGSQEPTQAGYNIAHMTQDSLFQELSKFPWRAERFAKGMSFHQNLKGSHVSHLLDCYPWSELGACTVVDLGGSHGTSSIALAKRFSGLLCIVQDLPGTIASCSVPIGLENRLTYMVHDFFTEQPIKGAEIYFFRWIFHDWSDEYSARILRSLVGALKPGAKILIQDSVIPEWGTTSLYDQRKYRTTDLTMLAMLNSRERSAEEWKCLFQLADPRFKLSKIIQPPFADLSIIEVVWCGS